MRYAVCLVAAVAGLITIGMQGVDAQRHAGSTEFTRIFQHLPAFAPPSARVRAALVELGRKGGLMDARDHLLPGRLS